MLHNQLHPSQLLSYPGTIGVMISGSDGSLTTPPSLSIFHHMLRFTLSFWCIMGSLSPNWLHSSCLLHKLLIMMTYPFTYLVPQLYLVPKRILISQIFLALFMASNHFCTFSIRQILTNALYMWLVIPIQSSSGAVTVLQVFQPRYKNHTYFRLFTVSYYIFLPFYHWYSSGIRLSAIMIIIIHRTLSIGLITLTLCATGMLNHIYVTF